MAVIGLTAVVGMLIAFTMWLWRQWHMDAVEMRAMAKQWKSKSKDATTNEKKFNDASRATHAAEQSLQTAEKNLVVAKGDLKEANAKVAELSKEILDLNKQVRMLESDASRTQNAAQNDAKRLEKLERTNKQLEDHLRAAREAAVVEKDTLTGTADRVQADLAETTTALAAARAEMDAMKAAHDVAAKRLRDEASDLEQQLLEAKLAAVQKQTTTTTAASPRDVTKQVTTAVTQAVRETKESMDQSHKVELSALSATLERAQRDAAQARAKLVQSEAKIVLLKKTVATLTDVTQAIQRSNVLRDDSMSPRGFM